MIILHCVMNSAKHCLQALVRVGIEDTTSKKDSFSPEGNIFVLAVLRLSLSACRNDFTTVPPAILT